MTQHLEGGSPDGRASSLLPADILTQVRGRVRLLAALLLCGFAFGLLLFASKKGLSPSAIPNLPTWRRYKHSSG